MLVTACETVPPASPPIEVCPTVTAVPRETQGRVAEALDYLETNAPRLYDAASLVVTDWIRMRDDARDCVEVLSP